MIEYKINITLLSNIHVGSGFSFLSLLDNTTIKNSEEVVFIPGSTLKGKLRSACKKICLSLSDEFNTVCQGKDSLAICKTPLDTACVICRLFGSAYNEGKLLFCDAFLPDDITKIIKIWKKVDPFFHIQSEQRSSNKISRPMRTAASKQLFTTESCPRELVFDATIRSKVDLNESEEKLLRWGAKSIFHIGGQKGKGLGRVSVNIERKGNGLST